MVVRGGGIRKPACINSLRGSDLVAMRGKPLLAVARNCAGALSSHIAVSSPVLSTRGHHSIVNPVLSLKEGMQCRVDDTDSATGRGLEFNHALVGRLGNCAASRPRKPDDPAQTEQVQTTSNDNVEIGETLAWAGSGHAGASRSGTFFRMCSGGTRSQTAVHLSVGASLRAVVVRVVILLTFPQPFPLADEIVQRGGIQNRAGTRRSRGHGHRLIGGFGCSLLGPTSV